jgi:nucleotide-binding universal stress UspA family protein
MPTITRTPAAGSESRAKSIAARPADGKAPLLVATDASPSSDDAVRVARAIAGRTGQPVHLIAVHVPMPLLSPEVQVAQGPESIEEAEDLLGERIREQALRYLSSGVSIEVVSGLPEAKIARAAERIGASMVIMGLGEHDWYQRLLGEEMVLRVIRLGTIPVLAVAPGTIGLPSRVLAATDFSPSSLRAAKLAQSITAPLGRITLAHVQEHEGDVVSWNNPNVAFHGSLGRAFDEALSHLRRDVFTDRTILRGDPAKALLERAELDQSDVIATGSHGFGFLTRLWLGSVSQRLVRGAKCSVLIAPPADGPGYLDELPPTTHRIEAAEWAEKLEEFTRRNSGRPVTIEVIDPDLGAQLVSCSVPLLGVDFDQRDSCIHLMLGVDTPDGRHVTRTVHGATAVQVLRTQEGRDLMLRIAHGRGQTLVTLERMAGAKV